MTNYIANSLANLGSTKKMKEKVYIKHFCGNQSTDLNSELLLMRYKIQFIYSIIIKLFIRWLLCLSNTFLNFKHVALKS